MRRARARVAEVVRRGEQTDAEMLLPQPVHQHPRGERIFRRRNPLGKREPTARGFRTWRLDLRRIRIEHAQKARLHFVARLGEIALKENARRLRAALAHGHRDGERALLVLHRVHLRRRVGVRFLACVIQRGECVLVADFHLLQMRLQLLLRRVVALAFRDLQQRLNVSRQLRDTLVAQLFPRGPERVVRGLLRGGDLFFQARVVRLDRVLLGGEVDGCVVARLHTGEERAEAEVIRLRERVVFVIVAIAAGEREAEERAAGRVHEVGHEIVPLLAILLKNTRRAVVGAESQKARGDERVGLGGGLRRGAHQLVARKLLADETVVRHVSVERAHHVVAVAPHLRAELVALVAVRVRVAHHVQPQPRRALAVARRPEQLVHQPLVGVGRFVGDERAHFLWRRRQAEQIEVKPANQRAAVGLGREGEFFLGEFREQESVDGIRGSFQFPVFSFQCGTGLRGLNTVYWILNTRHRRALRLLQRPQIKPLALPDFANGIFRVGPRVAEFLVRIFERELAGAGHVGIQALDVRRENEAVEERLVALVAGRRETGERAFAEVFPEISRHDGPRGRRGVRDGNRGPAGRVRTGDVAAFRLLRVRPFAAARQFDHHAAATAFLPREAQITKLVRLRALANFKVPAGNFRGLALQRRDGERGFAGEEIVRHEPQPAVAARERAEKMFLVLEEHRDRLGPRRTGLHPRFERGDVSLGQLFLRRHREVFRRVTHGLEQQTFLRVARHERVAVLAALERRCA